jgi:NADPH:quinone reductase-like Zn-dependent oxidoreductase
MSDAVRRAWAVIGSALELVDQPTPEPRNGEVLIRVAAASLNARDLYVIEGARVTATAGRPLILGSDAAGEVIAVGADVTRVRPGDHVASHFLTTWADGPAPANAHSQGLGGPLQGVLATHIALPQGAVVRAPRGLSLAETATLPTAALTAWNALERQRALQTGDVVVVQGTGGVSIFALQFAVAAGATVIVTSRSDAKLEQAQALGAAAGINSRRIPAWDDAVLELTDGRGADRVIEVAGGANLGRSLRATASGGEIALVGLFQGNDIRFAATSLIIPQAALRGVLVGSRRQFEAMNGAIERFGVRPVIDRTYALEDLPSALAHLQRGPFGKVVLRVLEP